MLREGFFMYVLTTLRGRLNGSASIRSAGCDTVFEIRRRGGQGVPAPAFAYLVSDAEYVLAETIGDCGRARITDARAILLTDARGRVLAEGCAGGERVRKRLEALKSGLARRENGPGAGEREVPHGAGPLSQAARTIAREARELFAGAAAVGTGGKNSEKPGKIGRGAEEQSVNAPVGVEKPAENDPTGTKNDPCGTASDPAGEENAPAGEVRNPFPRSLPRSRWFRGRGTDTLTGLMRIDGTERALTAERLRTGGRFSERGAWLMRGADGAYYAVRARPQRGE